MTTVVIAKQNRIVSTQKKLMNDALRYDPSMSEDQVSYLYYLTNLGSSQPELSDDEKLQVYIAFQVAYRACPEARYLSDDDLPGYTISTPIVNSYVAQLHQLMTTTGTAVWEAQSRNRNDHVANIAKSSEIVSSLKERTDAHIMAHKVIECYVISTRIRDAADYARECLGRKFCNTRPNAVQYGEACAKKALAAAEQQVSREIDAEIEMIYLARDKAREIVDALR